MESENRTSNESDKFALVKKTIFFILLAIFLIWLIKEIETLLICTFMAIILASAIAPAAEILERRKIPRVVTVIGLYIIVAIVYVVLAISLIPVIKEQANQLFTVVPQYVNRVLESVDKLESMAGNMAGADAVSQMDYATMAKDFGSKLVGRTLNFTQTLFEAILNGVFVLFLTSYFVIEAETMWPQLLSWLPVERRERVKELIRPLEVRLGGYVRGQVLVSVAVALILGTGLTLLHVKYSLILGLIAGLMNIVPFVGSIITCVFSIIVAANQSPMLGVATFGLFAFEQWLESNFIVPHLIGKNVDLHPLIVLFSLLIGGTLFGLAGAIIAVPMASAILFIAKEFYWKPINPSEVVND